MRNVKPDAVFGSHPAPWTVIIWVASMVELLKLGKVNCDWKWRKKKKTLMGYNTGIHKQITYGTGIDFRIKYIFMTNTLI